MSKSKEKVLSTVVEQRYAGDVLPQDAYRLLQDNPAVVLIDVRTQAEWSFVGVPDLSALGKATVFVEWQSFPTMARNEAFVEQVRAAVEDQGEEPTLLFLCRSGVRSIAAAEAVSLGGYAKSYNVVEGFEGGLDASGHRGAGGWKTAGLPWSQK